MYFLENNYEGAYECANAKENADKMDETVVIGVIPDLSYCCDLMDSNYIKMLSTYHRLLKIEYDALGKTLPENKDAARDSEYHLSAIVIDKHLQKHDAGKRTWRRIICTNLNVFYIFEFRPVVR